MTMHTGVLGLLLTLASAVAWSLFDGVRKAMARHVSPEILGVWLPLAQTPLLMVWAASQGPIRIPVQSLVPMAGSVALSLLGLLWFMHALKRSPMSITVPLLSFTPVLATLLAWGFRGQVPGPGQGLGGGLVVAGAMVMGLRSAHWPGFRAYTKEPGVRYMLGAALVWSVTAILNQVALERGANAWYAPLMSLAVGSLMAAVLLARGQRILLGESFHTLLRLPALSLSALIIGGSALAMELEALRLAPVGFIEIIKRGLGMSGAILLGRLFFREPVSLPKILAVVLMTAGVALVVM